MPSAKSKKNSSASSAPASNTGDLPSFEDDGLPDLNVSELEDIEAAMSSDGPPPLEDTDDSMPPPFDEDDAPVIKGMTPGILPSSTPAESGLIVARLESLINATSDYHNTVMNRLESIVPTVKSLSDSVGNRIDTLESSVDQLVGQVRSLGEIVSRIPDILEKCFVSNGAASAPVAEPNKASKPAKESKAAKEQPKNTGRIHTGATAIDVANACGVGNDPGAIVRLEKVLKALREHTGKMSFESFVQWLTQAKLSLQLIQQLCRVYDIQKDAVIQGCTTFK